MKHFSVCMEKSSDARKILSVLLSIETYHKDDYSCIISANKSARDFINNFPFTFTGKIEILDEIDEKTDFYNLVLRKINLIKYAVNKFGNTIHISTDIFQIRPMEIPDNVGDIAFIKKYSGHAPDMESQQYSLDVLYLENTKYCDFVVGLFDKLIDEERKKHEAEYEDQDEDEDISSCDDEDKTTERVEFHHLSANMIDNYKELWKNVTVSLVKEYSISEFLSFRTSLGSEDFFSYDKPLNMHQIDKDFVVTTKDKVDEIDEETGETVSKTVESKHEYIFVAPRINQHAPQIQDVNRAMFSRLVSYKLSNMSIINLKYSKTKMDFVCPKKDGIGIWNREKDAPGLHNLFSYFVERYGDYFSLTEDIIEYYSFNNYLISDKPGMIWLTNNVRKYTELLMCNHDQSLLDIKDSLPIPSRFFAYYSDHPKELEHYVLTKNNKSSKQLLEIDNESGEYVFRKGDIVERIDSSDFTFKDKMDAISIAKFVLVKDYDINLIANALAVSTIPVVADHIDVQDLVEGKHFVRQSKYSDNMKYSHMKGNCIRYYESSISPESVVKKLLNHVFIGSV